MQELGWKVVFSDAVDNRRSAIEVGDVTSVVLSRPRSIARWDLTAVSAVMVVV
jgi:hypothetical protein